MQDKNRGKGSPAGPWNMRESGCGATAAMIRESTRNSSSIYSKRTSSSRTNQSTEESGVRRVTQKRTSRSRPAAAAAAAVAASSSSPFPAGSKAGGAASSREVARTSGDASLACSCVRAGGRACRAVASRLGVLLLSSVNQLISWSCYITQCCIGWLWTTKIIWIGILCFYFQGSKRELENNKKNT
jgi:hypothetical protein